ncbi:unnamed protein product [Withania somnifera]
MISVGSRDGRNGIGLRFDCGAEKMEQTELEEGEAYNDDDSTIDPDVSLSYLDEKLHNVLGHFQRDFEGGVSAENLGSRFGGYGSFLPTYQRSPSWSHPRTPAEANNDNTQISPNNLLPEGGRLTSLGSSSTSISGRPVASSARSAAVPALKPPQCKGERNSAKSTTQAEDSNSKSEKVKKARNASDPKTLKVRIKVGTKNLSTRKNADIYSGLGLDVSPSSSLDGSPIGNEGVSHDLQVSPDESPTSILQIMTAHPIRDILLLSPLSDELISLTENEKLSGKCGYEGKKKASLETLALVNGTHYANAKVSEARKMKLCNKESLGKGKGYDNQNCSPLLTKKEIDIDGLACEELVSKALQLPLLSNPLADPPRNAEKTVDSSKTAAKGKTKEASSEQASKKSLLSVTAIDKNSIDGSDGKVSSSRRSMENKGTDCNHHSSGYLKKEGHNEEEEADDSSNNGQSKDGKAPSLDVVSPIGQPSHQKSSSNNGDGMKLAPEKELFASRDTMKPKGNQCHNAQSTEVIKEGSVADSFIASKGKKTSSSKILISKSDSEDMKKNLARDKYKEFFSDVELEDAETGLEKIHSKEMLKVSDAISKKRLERNSSMKEKVNGRETEKLFTSAEYPRLASNEAPHTVCESNPAVPPGAGAPLVKEDWVCCDKCQTWRILPLGTDPDSLPRSGFVDCKPGFHKSDSKDSLKKRKWSECQNPEKQPPRVIVEETCDNGGRKEKKARISKSGGKSPAEAELVEELTEKVEVRRKSKSFKRDLSALQPSVAATSSSSKVSGSHKNRTTLQELKGSPVESDISSSAKRNPKRKDDPKNANSIPSSTPKRSSYGENDRCSNRSGMIKKEEGSNGKHHGLESSGLDFQEKDVHDVSGATIKAKITGSDFATHEDTDVAADPLGQANQYACWTENSDQGLNNERRNNSQFHNNGSTLKDEKVLLSQHKEKNRTVRSGSGKCKTKDPDISNESSDRRTDEGKSTSGRNKYEDKFGASSDRSQQGSKKDTFGKLLNGDIQSKFVHHDGAEVKLDVSSLDKRQAALTDRNDGTPFRKLSSDKTQQIEVPEKGKAHLTSPSIRGQKERVQSSQPIPAFKKEGVANLSTLDAFEGEMLNASRKAKKSESHSGNTPNSLRQSTPPAHKVRDLDARSPIRKDSTSQAAANAIKEATNLKHMADRLKNSGSSESTSLYFQATLKFLHGASLLESCNDSAKHSEMNQSRQIYSSTAKLCEFVAHEYERLKDMAAVSLAYKCMEVAYMRVIYSSHFNANRYRNELQTALQIFPPGESPSSSASDVDNLNNPTMVEKVVLAKGVASPQVAGTHVISARNRASFTRLFNFAQEVNLAMDASRKSRCAFVAAYPGHSDTKCEEPALSVKKALDFNFQDVDSLLRLVRIAMEAISVKI